MEASFKIITGTDELEQFIARSQDAPVILFKHSLTCPISSNAYREMEKVQHDVALIVVQRARDVSREIETRTGVRHESPQALVMVNGQAVWSASHWDVTAGAINEAVQGAEKSLASEVKGVKADEGR